jgi:hypothetical protein
MICQPVVYSRFCEEAESNGEGPDSLSGKTFPPRAQRGSTTLRSSLRGYSRLLWAAATPAGSTNPCPPGLPSRYALIRVMAPLGRGSQVVYSLS